MDAFNRARVLLGIDWKRMSFLSACLRSDTLSRLTILTRTFAPEACREKAAPDLKKSAGLLVKKGFETEAGEPKKNQQKEWRCYQPDCGCLKIEQP